MTKRDAAAALTLPVSKRDHIQGPADAAVTLVEYGDYECPHCGRAYPIIIEYAGDLGLDVARFRKELGAGVYEPRVREDFRSGVTSGVNGTPTFFINGVRHDDSWELEPLLATLEEIAAATR